MLEHPHDPGRPLVLDWLHVQFLGELGIRGGGRHRDRTGVRGIREQRAEQDHELDAEIGERGDQLVTERPPAHVGLDPVHEDQVPVHALRAGQRKPGGGPDQPVGAAIGDLEHRAGHLEVVEVLGIHLADRAGLPGDAQMIDRPAGSLARVIPALERGDQRRRGEPGW
jgi:hypothetical protein